MLCALSCCLPPCGAVLCCSFKELEKYVLARRDELVPKEKDLLDDDVPIRTGAGKGFA